MGWREHLPVHPAADLFPVMSEMELRELGDDIAALGCPFDHLDGRVDPHDYVISVNLHRRHLTGEQKRELIARVLKAKPEESNRKIAKQTKADHKTVAAVRGDLESTGEIPQLEKTTGADGKQRKSRAKKKTRTTIYRPADLDPLPGVACASERRVTGPAEVSIEQRQAENAALDMPTEEEADESWQKDLYDQACLLLERMADATRQRFLAHLTAAPVATS